MGCQSNFEPRGQIRQVVAVDLHMAKVLVWKDIFFSKLLSLCDVYRSCWLHEYDCLHVTLS